MFIIFTGKPIFSIDIHPDGSRFATGGQGDGGSSGKVIIWNMMPVCSATDEKDEKVPKVLCVMDNHLGNFGFTYTFKLFFQITIQSGFKLHICFGVYSFILVKYFPGMKT